MRRQCRRKPPRRSRADRSRALMLDWCLLIRPSVAPELGSRLESQIRSRGVISDVLDPVAEGLPFYLWRIDNANNWMKAPPRYAAKKLVVDYFHANFHLATSGHFSTPALINSIAEIGVDRVMFLGLLPVRELQRRRGLVRQCGDRRGGPSQDRTHQRDEAVQAEGTHELWPVPASWA